MDAQDSLQRAHSLLQVGRAAEAEAAYRALLAQSPDRPEVLFGLSRALLAQQRFSEAEQAVARGQAADPMSVDGMVLRTAVALRSGRPQDGLEWARRAVDAAPGFWVTHHNYAAALLDLKQYEQALTVVEYARSLSPDSAGTEVLRAKALHALGRSDQARQAVAAALALDPENAEAMRLHGLLAILGRGAAPTSVSGAALRLDPTNQASRELHATALKARNPLYRALLRFGVAQQHWPRWARTAVMVAPIIAFQVLRPVADQTWAQVVFAALIAFLVLTWTLEPLMNATLLPSAAGRGLLTPLTRRATVAFLGTAVAALVFVGLSLADAGAGWGVLAAGTGLWAMSVGRLGEVEPRRLRLAVTLYLAGAAVAAVGVVVAALSPDQVWPGIVLIVGGIGMLWTVRLS